MWKTVENEADKTRIAKTEGERIEGEEKRV